LSMAAISATLWGLPLAMTKSTKAAGSGLFIVSQRR
jgi:hypothetical protein